jgi:hypothetical protein
MSTVVSKHRPQTPLKHRTPRGGNQCDFCGSVNVARLYPCTNFNWNAEPIFEKENGYWASCHLCAGIIDQEKWKELSARVMAEVKRRKALNVLEPTILQSELTQLQKDLVRLHKLFAASRTKPAIIVLESSRELGA